MPSFFIFKDNTMKTFFFLTILFVLAETANAQGNHTANDLFREAERSGCSEDYLKVCDQLYENEDNPDLFLRALSKVHETALRENNRLSIARYYDYKAEFDMMNGNLDTYMMNKRKAYDIYEKSGNKNYLSKCCSYIGNYFNAVGEYDSARIYLSRMMDYARQNPGEASYHLMTTGLADTYFRMGELDSAIVYEKKSAETSVLLKDSLVMLGNCRALGMYYRTKGDLATALEYYEQALTISLSMSGNGADKMEEITSLYVSLAVLCVDSQHEEEACDYAGRALEAMRSVTNELVLVQGYINISAVYLRYGKNDRADECINKGLALSEKMNMPENILRALGYKLNLLTNCNELDSTTYYRQKAAKVIPHVRAVAALLGYYQIEIDVLIARKQYEEALRVIAKIEQLPGISGRKFAMQELYSAKRLCYSSLGRYKEAYECTNEYLALSDSIFREQKAKELQELGVRYQTKEKEIEINRLEAEKDAATSRMWVRSVILISCLIFSVLIFVYLHHRQKVKAEQEQIRKYIEGLEGERDRLAKELHDGISNDLLALEMKHKKHAAGQPETEEMLASLADIRKSVRGISHELMPPSFVHATIHDILWDYVTSLSVPEGVKITFRSDPEDVDWSIIPPETGYAIYRIVQEALSNSLKHAAATSIHVGLELDGKTVNVCVVDDGKGYIPGSRDGVGIQAMRERTASVRGKFTINKRNVGTMVKCTIPLYNGVSF